MNEQPVKKHKIKTVVYMILAERIFEGGPIRILLQKRQNTGYMDGKYDFSASGHLEPAEPGEQPESLKQAAIREAREKLGVVIEAEDVEFKLLADENDDGYLKFVFMTSRWQGEPKILEPEKCAELKWFWVDRLPVDEMIPYLPKFYDLIRHGEYYHCGAF